MKRAVVSGDISESDIPQDRMGLSGLAAGFGHAGTSPRRCSGFESRTVHRPAEREP